MPVGAPVGNKNGARAHMWREAINRALDKRSAQGRLAALNDLAQALLDKAATGDVPALKELGDRMDGKAAQQIYIGDDDRPTKIMFAWIDKK